jgi:hypothetical protein
MNAFQLITILEQFPPTMEVMLDITRDNSEMFKFVSIRFADEIETSLDEKIILLSSDDFEAEKPDPVTFLN